MRRRTTSLEGRKPIDLITLIAPCSCVNQGDLCIDINDLTSIQTYKYLFIHHNQYLCNLYANMVLFHLSPTVIEWKGRDLDTRFAVR